jgi:hypothetical protein
VDDKHTALPTGVNSNTVNRYFNLFGRVIYGHQPVDLVKFFGTVEVDVSIPKARMVQN